MASRPSPPKPYERSRLSQGTPDTLKPASSAGQGSARDLSSGARAPPRERVSSSYARERSFLDAPVDKASSSLARTSGSSTSDAPRTPPRPWDSSGRDLYSSYRYGGASDRYRPGDRYRTDSYYDRYDRYDRWSSPYSSYGGYLNPYSRDPKYLFDDGPYGFAGAMNSSFTWVNDFQNVVQTFARISWLLDTNIDTMYNTFLSVVRFFDRVRHMSTAEIAPILHALIFFGTLGLAGAKFSEWIRAPAHLAAADGNADVEVFQRLSTRSGGRRSKILWLLIFLGLFATFFGPLVMRFLLRRLRRARPAAALTHNAASASSASTAEEGGPRAPVVARALYDFEGDSRDDLPFLAGDQILVVARRSEGWLEGKLGSRCGLVPENYVEILPEEAQDSIPPRFEELRDDRDRAAEASSRSAPPAREESPRKRP